MCGESASARTVIGIITLQSVKLTRPSERPNMRSPRPSGDIGSAASASDATVATAQFTNSRVLPSGTYTGAADPVNMTRACRSPPPHRTVRLNSGGSASWSGVSKRIPSLHACCCVMHTINVCARSVTHEHL